MLRLLNFRCSFCSNPLDETHASQLWRVSALGGGRYSFTSASGLALDDRGQRTSEGNTVWLYEPNGGPAQAWVLT